MALKEWFWPIAPTSSAWAGAVSGPVSVGVTAALAAPPLPDVPDKVVPLQELAPQEEAVIVGFTGGGGGNKGVGCPKRLQALGLRRDLAIRMLHNPGCGLVLVQVNGARLALGRGVAAKIMVRRRRTV